MRFVIFRRTAIEILKNKRFDLHFLLWVDSLAFICFFFCISKFWWSVDLVYRFWDNAPGREDRRARLFIVLCKSLLRFNVRISQEKLSRNCEENDFNSRQNRFHEMYFRYYLVTIIKVSYALKNWIMIWQNTKLVTFSKHLSIFELFFFHLEALKIEKKISLVMFDLKSCIEYCNLKECVFWILNTPWDEYWLCHSYFKVLIKGLTHDLSFFKH